MQSEAIETPNSQSALSKFGRLVAGNYYAFRGAYQQELQVNLRTASALNFVIGGIPAGAVMAWVALRSQNSATMALLSVGACLMVMWNTAVFRIGWSASNEIEAGVFHTNLLSRTPISVIMLGKAVSYVSFTATTGVAVFLVVLAITRRFPDPANLPAFLVSIAVAMFAMVCASFIFAPIAVLMGGKGGFFNAIMPFGIVFSGFLYPVSVLPGGFKILARMLPTSYVMDGIIHSISGQVSIWRIAGDWGIALAVSLAYIFAAYFLFMLVERRVRATGVLSTF